MYDHCVVCLSRSTLHAPVLRHERGWTVPPTNPSPAQLVSARDALADSRMLDRPELLQ